MTYIQTKEKNKRGEGQGEGKSQSRKQECVCRDSSLLVCNSLILNGGRHEQDFVYELCIM